MEGEGEIDRRIAMAELRHAALEKLVLWLLVLGVEGEFGILLA